MYKAAFDQDHAPACGEVFVIVKPIASLTLESRMQSSGAMGKLLMKHAIFQKDDALRAMSINELWTLHENIAAILVKKIEGEKLKLQDRLDELNGRFGVTPVHGKPRAKARARRPYPKVNPKFQNPERPSETWAGRGKKPHWVSELLETGRSIDDLRIQRTLEIAL